MTAGIGLALLAGCGGSDEEAGALPECAGADDTVATPSQLPKGFPLPPGFALTFAHFDEPGTLSLKGAAPGTVDDAVAFFQRELEANGYELGRQDQEPGEAEAGFAGNGYQGGWSVHALRDCDAVSVGIIVVRQQ